MEILATENDEKTNILTFKTNKFSDYAIAVSDKTAESRKTSNTNMGDDMNAQVLFAVLVSALAAVFVTMTIRRRYR